MAEVHNYYDRKNITNCFYGQNAFQQLIIKRETLVVECKRFDLI